MKGSLFERLNRQIIDPNYVLPPLNSENNIKGCDCRIIIEHDSSNKNTLLENMYKFEILNQLSTIRRDRFNKKKRLYNLSPETINYITQLITLPINSESFEFENKTLKTQSSNTKSALHVRLIQPLSVATCKNIKNGGLFNDYTIEI